MIGKIPLSSILFIVILFYSSITSSAELSDTYERKLNGTIVDGVKNVVGVVGGVKDTVGGVKDTVEDVQDIVSGDVGVVEGVKNIVGGDKDENGCIGSAGYTWCEPLQACIRSFETNCTEPAVGDDVDVLGGNVMDKVEGAKDDKIEGVKDNVVEGVQGGAEKAKDAVVENVKDKVVENIKEDVEDAMAENATHDKLHNATEVIVPVVVNKTEEVAREKVVERVQDIAGANSGKILSPIFIPIYVSTAIVLVFSSFNF